MKYGYKETKFDFEGKISSIHEDVMDESMLSDYVTLFYTKQKRDNLFAQIGQKDGGEIEIQGRKIEVWLE